MRSLRGRWHARGAPRCCRRLCWIRERNSSALAATPAGSEEFFQRFPLSAQRALLVIHLQTMARQSASFIRQSERR